MALHRSCCKPSRAKSSTSCSRTRRFRCHCCDKPQAGAISSLGSDAQQLVVHDNSSTLGFKGGLRAVQNGVVGVTPEERTKRQFARKMEDAWLNGKGSLGMVLMANRVAAKPDEKAGIAPGHLLPAILRWPSPYTFNVVVKPPPGVPSAVLVGDICGCIGQVCGQDVDGGQCRVTERMQGKYLSLAVTLVVSVPEHVTAVHEALAKDDRVKMRF